VITNNAPRNVVIVSMLWLGLLVITSQGWWQKARDYVEKRTH
jgi:hypothetical protein